MTSKPQLLLLCLIFLACTSATHAQRPGTDAVQHAFRYELTAQRIGTGEIIEFTPMDIKWTLAVTKIGIAGTEPRPVDISICPVINTPDSQFQCGKISNASPGHTFQRTMKVPAPPAGMQSPLRIVALRAATGGEDYGQREVVAEAAVKLDVAASYDLSIASFDVLTTRSTSTDTVWVSLQGQITANPPHASASPDACQLAGFNWCTVNQPYGDVHDSGVRRVNNVRIGPYDLVPERERDLRAMFYLDNHGNNISQEIGLGVANAFSKVGMIALSAYGAQTGSGTTGGFATQLDDLMGQFHSTATASCDGKLADGVVVIANSTRANQSQNTLDAFTKATGSFVNPVMNGLVAKIFHETDGDFRCDRRGGQYKVSYAVYRTSWRAWGFSPRW